MSRLDLGKAALAIALAGASIHAAAVWAADETKPLRAAYYACVKASRGVTAALNDCIGTEHAYQDKRLNTAYKAVRASLAEPQRTALRDEERAWITSRDKKCAPDPDGGTGAMLDSNQCALDETAARAATLEGRVSGE